MFNKRDVEILSCQTDTDRNAERGGKLTFYEDKGEGSDDGRGH